MTEHNNDFRPLPVGWYVEFEDTDEGVEDYAPCPGLVRDEVGNWWPAYADGLHLASSNSVSNAVRLVYRPDLAHLPGELEVRQVGGVEYVRQSVPTSRRVLGPDTPFPGAKSAYSAEA